MFLAPLQKLKYYVKMKIVGERRSTIFSIYFLRKVRYI